MKTIGDDEVRRALVRRLESVAPSSVRRWGTLTPHEMFCHLGDAMEMVLLRRPRPNPARDRTRRLVKRVGLWSPLRWPRGWQTNPSQDPRREGTRPSHFANDRDRAIGLLQELGRIGEGGLEPLHGFFGRMSTRDWHRWAYKHTDHHLRQFGA